MADISDPQILQAYKNVRDDKLPTSWLLINYEGDKSDKLKLTATGEGGLDDFKEHLKPTDCGFGYIRVGYANDKESKREKFIFVVWIGSEVKVMRKAKVSVHAADVKVGLNAFSIEVYAREREEINEEAIVVRLRKAGGASYDGV